MYGKCSQELAPTIHLSILTISHNLLLKDFDTNLITYEVNFCINNSKFIIVTTIFQATDCAMWNFMSLSYYN